MSQPSAQRIRRQRRRLLITAVVAACFGLALALAMLGVFLGG